LNQLEGFSSGLLGDVPTITADQILCAHGKLKFDPNTDGGVKNKLDDFVLVEAEMWQNLKERYGCTPDHEFVVSNTTSMCKACRSAHRCTYESLRMNVQYQIGEPPKAGAESQAGEDDQSKTPAKPQSTRRSGRGMKKVTVQSSMTLEQLRVEIWKTFMPDNTLPKNMDVWVKDPDDADAYCHLTESQCTLKELKVHQECSLDVYVVRHADATVVNSGPRAGFTGTELSPQSVYRQHCEMAAAAGSDGSNNDDNSGEGVRAWPDGGSGARWAQRQPGAGMLQSEHSLLQEIEMGVPARKCKQLGAAFTHGGAILKLKGSFTGGSTVHVDALINALAHTTNIQILYIQGLAGMRDKQLEHLMEVLSHPDCTIWAMNIGECPTTVSDDTWWSFVKRLKSTKIGCLFAEPNHLQKGAKEAMIETLRKNRNANLGSANALNRRWLMAENPDNVDVIMACDQMWWHPATDSRNRRYLEETKNIKHLKRLEALDKEAEEAKPKSAR